MKLAHLPLRVATGAYILNSGMSKQGLEGQAAEGLHGMASDAIPPVKSIPPEQFAKILSTGEIALGAALLIPFRAFGLGWSSLGWILRRVGSALSEDTGHAAARQPQTHPGRHWPRQGCLAGRCRIDLAP